MDTKYYPPVNQLLGHTSPDTAFTSNNYFLNKTQTPIRYWIESNGYGQRVMRQLYDTRGGKWWNPKPHTTYAPIVVMYFEPSDVEQINGTSVRETLTVTQLNLREIPDEQLSDPDSQFHQYFRFDDTQYQIIERYLANKNQSQTTATNDPASELEAMRIEAARIRLERQKLKLAEDIARAERRANPQPRAETISTPKKDPWEKVSAKLATVYGTRMNPFNEEQLKQLRDMAFESAHHLPGSLQPWNLDLDSSLILAKKAAQRKITRLDELDERRTKYSGRDLARFDSLLPQLKQEAFALDEDDKQRNAVWYEREAKRRENEDDAPKALGLDANQLLSEMSQPVPRDI